jgi:hypothetical protein
MEGFMVKNARFTLTPSPQRRRGEKDGISMILSMITLGKFIRNPL